MLICTVFTVTGSLLLSTITSPATIFAQSDSTSTSTSTEITYTVKPGDSLSVIAKEFGVSMADLVARNGLSNADFVYVGQQLLITQSVPPTATVTSELPIPATISATITVTENVALSVTQATSDTVPATAAPTATASSVPTTTEPTAAPTTTPTVVPTPEPTATAVTTIYTVQAGDTLSAIARRFRNSTADLIARNGLRNANYVYVGQRLEVLIVEELPTDTGSSTDEASEATRINFAPDTTSATVEGSVIFPTRLCYILEASAGQEMQVAISSGGALANFLVRAADQSINGGVPLKRLENEDRNWQTILPASGDYLICVATAEGAVAYTLTVTIPVACTSVTQEIQIIDWAMMIQNDSALAHEEIGEEEYVTVLASPTNTTGVPQLDQIVYGDFDGDCIEEAAIPLFSGGTAGNIGFLVYDLPAEDSSSSPALVAWGEGYKLSLTADSGLLVVSNALYRGWEPNCCPSGFSYEGYRLQEGALILVSTESEGISEMRVATVSHFYELLQARNFVQAYALLSPAFQAANPFDRWEAGYANTETIVATVTPDPTVTERVSVTLEVNERLSSGVTRVRHYSGYWDLSWHGEDPGWRLIQGSFAVVP